MLKLFASIFGIALFSLPSCNDNGIICTEEFAMVGVTINGTQPDRTFTLRVKTGDTLNNTGFQTDQWYPVATDELRDALRNKQENFTFIGMKNDTVIYSANYVIGADDCHIYKISGPDSL